MSLNGRIGIQVALPGPTFQSENASAAQSLQPLQLHNAHSLQRFCLDAFVGCNVHIGGICKYSHISVVSQLSHIHQSVSIGFSAVSGTWYHAGHGHTLAAGCGAAVGHTCVSPT